MLKRIFLATTCVASVLAQVKTVSVTIDPRGFSPAPTRAPGYRSPAELFKRQSLTTQICGYVSGGTDSAFCNPGWSCGFSTAQSVFGCCSIGYSGSGDNCFQPTTCADYENVPAPKYMQEHLTHYCYDPDWPYCAVITGDGMSAFWCDNVPSRTFPFNFILNSTEITSSNSRASSSFHFMTPTLSGAVGTPTTSEAFSRTQFHGEATTVPSSTSTTSSGSMSFRSAKSMRYAALVLVMKVLADL